jgi:drug/metabolite transporter (DMT)-like permease
LLAAAAAGLWAFSGNLGKYAMHGELGAVSLAQGRTVVAVLCLALYVATLGRHSWRLPRRRLLWLILFGVLLGLVQFAYFAAIERIQVAAAVLLEYLAPALVVAWAWALQARRPSPVTLAAVAAAITGCALVVRAYDPTALSLSAAGVGFGLAAAVTFAGYILVGEHVQEEVPVAPRLLVGFSVALVTLLLLQPPWRFPWGDVDRTALGAVILVGTAGTLLPFSAFMASLRYLDAGRATIVSTLEPVIAGLIAFLWLGETLSWPQVIGVVLVIAAVAGLQLDPQTEAVAGPETALPAVVSQNRPPSS